MLEKNLNPQSFQLILLGSILGLMTYGISAFITKQYVKQVKYRITVWTPLLLLLGSFVAILFSSVLIQAYFIERTETDYGEYIYHSSVENLDIMLPMLLSSFVAIVFTSWKRHRELNDYWGQDHHPIRDIKRMDYEE